jgi:transcriptional regulator with XRE-family HTH domain
MKGKELRAIRKKFNWTQAELAKALGIASNTVARYERDEIGIKQPTARLVKSIYTTEQSKAKWHMACKVKKHKKSKFLAAVPKKPHQGGPDPWPSAFSIAIFSAPFPWQTPKAVSIHTLQMNGK